MVIRGFSRFLSKDQKTLISSRPAWTILTEIQYMISRLSQLCTCWRAVDTISVWRQTQGFGTETGPWIRGWDRPVGLVLRQTRGFGEAIFPSSSYWSGSLSSWNSVLKNATFWWEFRHQLFSFLVARHSVSFFGYFGFLVKLVHFRAVRLKLLQTERIIFMCLSELCKASSLWAPLQKVSVSTPSAWPLCDTLQHAGGKYICDGKETEGKISFLTQYCTSFKSGTSC